MGVLMKSRILLFSIIVAVLISEFTAAQPGLPGNYAPPLSSLDLSELTGKLHGFALNGEAANDHSGSAISFGDINGDGYEDVLIGVQLADPNGTSSGKTYVVFGKASGFSASLELSGLNGTTGFVINGEAANDRSGVAISSGDINGDGYEDVLIGANSADPNGSSSGKTYVVFGKVSGFSASLELSALNGTTGFVINGEAASDGSGGAVSSGDINGDGYEDVLIGARSADPNGSSSGKTYVVFGKASGFSASLELSGLNGTTGFVINGEAASDGSGGAVSSGDINGDGYEDVLIGAQSADPNGAGSGKTYVVFGKASEFLASLELSGLNGTTGFDINGEVGGDGIGGAVSSGDINGDGYEDVLIGAQSADPNGISNSGKTYVVFGKASGFSASLELSGLNGTTGFDINGEAENDFSGDVLSSGDINGDGYGDVLVGASGADPNGSSSGKTYVVFGKASGFDSEIELSMLNGINGFGLNGAAISDQSGGAVSSGDINGDGYEDVLVGASSADPNGSSSGKTYVFTNTAEQTISGNEGFRMLGSPASGKVFDKLVGPFWTQGFTNSDAAPFGLNTWTWNHTNQSWNGLSNQLTDNLAAGSGFLFYLFSNDNNTGIDEGFPKTITSPASLVSVSNYDILTSTDKVYPFDDLADGSYFFAANPYSVPINWDALSGWTKTNMSNTIYIWNDAGSAWQTWNGFSGTLSGEGVLQPFQGFFVQASGGVGELAMTEAVQTNTAGSLYKTAPGPESSSFSIKVESDEFASTAIVAFHPEGKPGKDRFDGSLLTPLSPQYVQAGSLNPKTNEQHSINVLGYEDNQYQELSLHLSGAKVSAKAMLTIEGLDKFGKDWEVSLKDTQTGLVTELSDDVPVQVELELSRAKSVSGLMPAAGLAMQQTGNPTGPRYKLIIRSGTFVGTEKQEELPSMVALEQNYPNPFNPSTVIGYQLPESSRVTLEVFDVTGRKVATLLNGKRIEAGKHYAVFNAGSLASGIYIYRLQAENTILTRKLTLIK